MRLKAQVIAVEDARRAGKNNNLYMQISCLDLSQPALKNTFDYTLVNEEIDEHKEACLPGKTITLDVSDISQNNFGRIVFRGKLVLNGK